jgi:hypothetical protein
MNSWKEKGRVLFLVSASILEKVETKMNRPLLFKAGISECRFDEERD